MMTRKRKIEYATKDDDNGLHRLVAFMKIRHHYNLHYAKIPDFRKLTENEQILPRRPNRKLIRSSKSTFSNFSKNSSSPMRKLKQYWFKQHLEETCHTPEILQVGKKEKMKVQIEETSRSALLDQPFYSPIIHPNIPTASDWSSPDLQIQNDEAMQSPPPDQSSYFPAFHPNLPSTSGWSPREMQSDNKEALSSLPVIQSYDPPVYSHYNLPFTSSWSAAPFFFVPNCTSSGSNNEDESPMNLSVRQTNQNLDDEPENVFVNSMSTLSL